MLCVLAGCGGSDGGETAGSDTTSTQREASTTTSEVTRTTVAITAPPYDIAQHENFLNTLVIGGCISVSTGRQTAEQFATGLYNGIVEQLTEDGATESDLEEADAYVLAGLASDDCMDPAVVAQIAEHYADIIDG